MKTEILENIGLSKNEIKIYFALLDLDQATATPIVKRSGVPNSKVYPTLDKLIKRGLVSYVIKNNVKHFQASDPRHLLDFLKNKEELIAKQKKEIADLIPQIEKKRELAKDKQEAAIYEGIEGVKTAFEEILNTLKKGEEYYVFTLGQELEREDLRLFFSNYHAKRVEKGIKVKLILSNKLRDLVKLYRYKNMFVKFTSLILPTGIFIYKNKVMTLVWGDKPTAFVIQSEINADKYLDFFLDLWEKAEK